MPTPTVPSSRGAVPQAPISDPGHSRIRLQCEPHFHRILRELGSSARQAPRGATRAQDLLGKASAGSQRQGSRAEQGEPPACDVGLTPRKGKGKERGLAKEMLRPQHGSERGSASLTGAPEQRLSVGGVPGWAGMAQLLVDTCSRRQSEHQFARDTGYEHRSGVSLKSSRCSYSLDS